MVNLDEKLTESEPCQMSLHQREYE